MPDNLIQVGAAVDVSGLKDLVTQSDAVSDAYKRLAEAQLQANTASTAASNTLKALSTGELPNVKSVLNDYAQQLQAAASASTAFKSAQDEVQAALNPIPPKLEDVNQETEKATMSMQQYRQAAQLAAREIGVNMPRALTSLIIQSESARAVLGAAFSGIAIIGFISILKQVGDKLGELISDTFIYTDAMKTEDRVQGDLNKRWEETAKRIKAINREMELQATQSESGKDALRLKFNLEDIGGTPAEIKAAIAKIQKQIQDATKDSTETEMVPTADATAMFPQLTVKAIAAAESIKGLNSSLSELQRQLAEATAVEKQGAQTIANDLTVAANKEAADAQAAADKRAKAAAAANKKILAEQSAFQKSMNEINNEAAKKVKEDSDEALKEAIAGNTRIAQAYIKRYAEQKAAADTAIKDEIDQDKLASNNKIQLIEQDFLKGKINQQQEIAAIAQEKENELELEKLAQQKRWALWTGDVKKQAEIQKEINKIVAQANNVQTKAVTDGLRAQEQQYKQLFSQIGSAITSNALDVSKGTETIAQAFQKMYQSLIAGVADYLAKKAEKKAEEWAIDKLFKQAQTDTSISAAAAQAYAYGFADSAETGPEGLAAAPAVAAGAAAAVQAGARPIAQLAIGTNYVPMDGLAYLHKGEKVIPAGTTGSGYSGSGGNTVIVHHTVQAVDAASFQQHIRRHSSMIANEVTRALKKKS